VQTVVEFLSGIVLQDHDLQAVVEVDHYDYILGHDYWVQ
jgi:hypothetical protein